MLFNSVPLESVPRGHSKKGGQVLFLHTQGSEVSWSYNLVVFYQHAGKAFSKAQPGISINNQIQTVTLPKIGILGGMGPAATILLQQRILDATSVETDGDHLPLLIDVNTQVPSRINFLIHGRGESPGPVLARMAKGLQQNGADVIVMPCCTAHHFADEIVESVSIPFLNMVQLACVEAAHRVQPDSKVGILASPATQKIELFKRELQSQGLKEHYPGNMRALLSAINAIKKSGPCPEIIEGVQSAIVDLETSQAKAIIVGCSEFSMISSQLSSTVPIIDAVSVLTQAIARWKKGTQ